MEKNEIVVMVLAAIAAYYVATLWLNTGNAA